MDLLGVVTDLSAYALGNAMYQQSLDKFKATFGNVANPDALVSIVIQRRKLDGKISEERDAFLEDDFTFGMMKGQVLNIIDYPGFEGIWLNSVTLRSGVQLVATNFNRFASDTIISNGTPRDYTKKWSFLFPSPHCVVISCESCEQTGTVLVDDKYWLDRRFWGLVIVMSIFLFIIIVIICSEIKKNSTYKLQWRKKPSQEQQ